MQHILRECHEWCGRLVSPQVSGWWPHFGHLETRPNRSHWLRRDGVIHRGRADYSHPAVGVVRALRTGPLSPEEPLRCLRGKAAARLDVSVWET